MSTIFAELAIYGDNLKPAQITDLLEIVPSETWLRGDIKNRRTNACYEYGCWKTSTTENASSLEDHVRILIERVSNCEHLIHSFVVKHGDEIEVSAIVRLGEESPDISLSKEVIAWMCGIGAGLDIDMY